MSQLWIERLQSAPSKVERDEILLRDFKSLHREFDANASERIRTDVEDQLRALADLAFPPTVL